MPGTGRGRRTVGRRKEKTLRIALQDQAASGYVLLFITTVDEDSSTPWAQSLLMVEPAEGDPELSVSTGQAFSPGEGQELAIHAAHRFPLRLSVQILDQAGAVICSLAQRQPSRPEHLPDEGSLFYWTGRADDGSPAPRGEYRARVSAAVGGQSYQAVSQPFRLE